MSTLWFNQNITVICPPCLVKFKATNHFYILDVCNASFVKIKISLLSWSVPNFYGHDVAAFKWILVLFHGVYSHDLYNATLPETFFHKVHSHILVLHFRGILFVDSYSFLWTILFSTNFTKKVFLVFCFVLV